MTSLGSEALPARLFRAIPALREALLAAAGEGRVVGTAEASEATGGAVAPRGLGRALEVISADCARRGEPDLAVLVVREAALADGSDTGGGSRRRAWRHFGGQDAVERGDEDERLAAERVTRTAGAARPAAARARRAPSGSAATAPAPVATPPAPPSTCPDCFTVRSASGACMCV